MTAGARGVGEPLRVESCPDCEAACLRAKSQGFRPWRGAFACYEHAAVDWNDFCAEHGITFDEVPAEQPDLFSLSPKSEGLAA